MEKKIQLLEQKQDFKDFDALVKQAVKRARIQEKEEEIDENDVSLRLDILSKRIHALELIVLKEKEKAETHNVVKEITETIYLGNKN